MVLDTILNPVFKPLLNAVGPLWTVVIMSIVISFLITIIYKYATNQTLMKQLKDDLKKDQERMKKLKSDPKKMMEIQKSAMEKNMKYMMQSMRATLITFLPIILVFGWMNGHLGAESLKPNMPFIAGVEANEGISGNVTLRFGDATTGANSTNIMLLNASAIPIEDGKARWVLKAGSGRYFLEFEHGGARATRYVTITNGLDYEQPIIPQKDSPFKALVVEHNKLIVLNLFGWKLGWLGTYIILSIISSMALRKLLKVY